MTEGSRVWRTPEDIDHFVALRLEHRRTMPERRSPLKIWTVLPEACYVRKSADGLACAPSPNT
ncbi:hypothetical protein [Streptosporangium sp. V21-05]|uniref:hypothetical protein n=1 Tax=Streptosporangium sp. V21-05 TaxID=3446115 RepID=UPI003F529B87